jgi:hypothetical protein
MIFYTLLGNEKKIKRENKVRERESEKREKLKFEQ